MKAHKRNTLSGVIQTRCGSLKDAVFVSCSTWPHCGHCLLTCPVPVGHYWLCRNASLALLFPYFPPWQKEKKGSCSLETGLDRWMPAGSCFVGRSGVGNAGCDLLVTVLLPSSEHCLWHFPVQLWPRLRWYIFLCPQKMCRNWAALDLKLFFFFFTAALGQGPF